MGRLFGGASTNAQNPPDYTQAQIQTSSEGMALPVVWGVNRVSPNLVWIDNFQEHKGGGKKGGGKGGGKNTGATFYTAGFVLAVCEGPITGIADIYVNNNYIPETAAELGFGVFPGTTTQTPASLIASAGYVPMAYRNVCYLAANAYDLGPTPSVPQHAMEIEGFRAGTSSGTFPDVNPADIIYDLWTDIRYGLGLPANLLGDSTQFRTYCTALSILLSPVLYQSEQAISILQRWAQLTNSWIFWSENLLKFVPLGDQVISGYGVTYTPNNNVIYDLTYDDFVSDKTEPPVTVTRSDPSDTYNWVKVNISDRLNQYSTAVIEYKDQASIEKYGLLQANEIQANEVTIRGIGGVIAGLIGQRAVYVRNTYAFKTSYNFVLLEPGDIVTITDVALGLTRHPVRIRTIDEDDKGNLKFTAEECPSGVGAAAVVGVQPTMSVGLPAMNVDPGNINPPAIIEPPASVTGGAAQVWVGLSGASQYWGGAQAFISLDDVTYIAVGSVNQATPQGTLLAALAAHADPDTVNTLKIDFTESRQTISSTATHADADALRSVVLVNNEVMGFGSVVPDGTNSFSYDLSYLRRGAYNTTIAAAAIGDPACVMLPGTMLKFGLPAAYVGQTIYLKFTSFNLYGAGTQDISTVTRYTYVPTGVVYTIAPPTSPTLAVTTPAGAAVISMTLGWTASAGPVLGSYEVQFSADGGTTWTAADVTVGSAAVSYTLTPAKPATSYQARVRAISASGSAVSSWATSAVLSSGSVAIAVPSTPTGLAATPGASQNVLAWAANAATDSVTAYRLYRASGTGAAFSSASLIATLLALNYTDPGLPPGGAYTYFLTAVNSAGESAHTAGVNATVLTLQNLWAPSVSLSGRLLADGEELFAIELPFPVSLPAGLTGSGGGCEVAATANATFTLYQNGTAIGTATLAAGAVGRGTATFAMTSAMSGATGDVISFSGPTPHDTTLKGVYFTFLGNR